MKHTFYIICLAIVSLLLIVSLLTSNGLNRALTIQTDSTTYWKGRYDSVVKADSLRDYNSLSGLWKAAIKKIKGPLIIPKEDIISNTIDHVSGPNTKGFIRYARHRKDTSNMWNNFDSSIHVIRDIVEGDQFQFYSPSKDSIPKADSIRFGSLQSNSIFTILDNEAN